MVRGKAAIVLTFVLAVTIGVIFLAPAVNAVNENTGTQSVTNETVAADLGHYVDLSGYDIDKNSETVYGYNDTSGAYELVDSADYVMNYSDGSIKVESSSAIVQDGEDIKVSYDYQASGDVTTTVVGFIPVMLGTLLLFAVSRGVMKEM